jgi:mRNA interferase HigB
MFNIIARKTILDYCQRYREASPALKLWYHTMQKLEITNMNELKEVFPNASIIEDNRIVFNICGNRYRLVVRIVFEFKVIQIKWFGKHNEYDRINAGKIDFN